MSVKDHIRGTSCFVKYFDGNLWYQTSDTNFLFPVPVNDIGTATFDAEVKSLLMMRYIRKWMELIKAPASDTD